MGPGHDLGSGSVALKRRKKTASAAAAAAAAMARPTGVRASPPKPTRMAP